MRTKQYNKNKLYWILLIQMVVATSCGNNHHLNETKSADTKPATVVIEPTAPAVVPPVVIPPVTPIPPAIPPLPTINLEIADIVEIGESISLNGTCSPAGTVIISSTSMVPSIVNCNCDGSILVGCGSVSFDGSNPTPSVTTQITDEHTQVANDSDDLIVNSIELDCTSSVMATGIFESPGLSSTGSILIPIKSASPGTINITINDNGFSSNKQITLSGGETSINIDNLLYDGSSLGGYQQFEIKGDGITGTCNGEAIVLSVTDRLFGFSGGEYIEDGVNGICSMKNDKSVWCWGTKADLHNGSTTPGALNQITGFTDVPSRILPLEANGFVITDMGTIESFGIQTSGSKALGQNGVNGYNAPGSVSGWSSTLSIRNIKGDHSDACGVLSDNSMWCWGKNDEGELGDGTGSTSSIPVGPVATDVKKMFHGGDVHCYIATSGKAYCSGEGSNGELGDGLSSQSDSYVEVKDIDEVVEMSIIGRGDTEAICALREDGSVWCWGENTYGQLGDGTNIDKNIPTNVAGISGIVKILGGRYHFCGLKSDGSAWCWGRNNQGQLGDGTTTDRSTPIKVQDSSGDLNSLSQLGVGENHSCALKNDGTTWCWGDNVNQQLGDGTTTDRTTAVQFGSASNPIADGIKVYFDDTCMVTSSGDAYCSGRHSGPNTTTIIISF